MKRRNPPARRRRTSPIANARTPGEALFNMVMSAGLTGERQIKLITSAAQMLAAEARAGLWTDRASS